MRAQTFILPSHLPHAIDYIRRLPESRKWRVSIEPYRKPRSDQQNRYLFGVAYAALEAATGQPKEDWHEYMLGEHFGWEESELFGKKRLRPLRRSSKLSTAEFADYVAFVQMRAAEHNIYIPDPNE